MIENVDNDETVGQGIDRINAAYFNEAGNRASGLLLDEIGMTGHGLANTLWRVSAYLRMRADRTEPKRHSPYPRQIDNIDGGEYV